MTTVRITGDTLSAGILETDDVTRDVTLTRSGDTTEAASVQLTLVPAASNGLSPADFDSGAFPVENVIFLAGQTEVTVRLDIFAIGGDGIEGAEFADLMLLNPVDVAIGAPDPAVSQVQILDTDFNVEAIDRTPTIDEDNDVQVNLIRGNESNVENAQTLDVVIDTQPENGTVTFGEAVTTSSGAEISPLIYQPDENFSGEDEFTYTITGTGPLGDTMSDSGTVSVTVDPVNDAPIAADGTESALEDSDAFVIELGDLISDAEGSDLTIVDANASRGQVSVNSGETSLTYRPPANFFGDVEVVYQVQDPEGQAALGTVVVTVEPVNDDPVANDDTADAVEDTVSDDINILANDTDIDDDAEEGELFVTNASALNGEVVINDDYTLAYTPNADFFGTDMITYTVEDDDGGSAEANVEIEVAPVNDAPVAQDDDGGFIPGATVVLHVLENDTDVDLGEDEQLTITSVEATGGTATIVGDGSAIQFTSNGTDPSLSYTVSDGQAEDSANVDLTLNTVIEDPEEEEDDGGAGDMFIGLILAALFGAVVVGAGMGGGFGF